MLKIMDIHCYFARQKTFPSSNQNVCLDLDTALPWFLKLLFRYSVSVISRTDIQSVSASLSHVQKFKHANAFHTMRIRNKKWNISFLLLVVKTQHSEGRTRFEAARPSWLCNDWERRFSQLLNYGYRITKKIYLGVLLRGKAQKRMSPQQMWNKISFSVLQSVEGLVVIT